MKKTKMSKLETILEGKTEMCTRDEVDYWEGRALQAEEMLDKIKHLLDGNSGTSPTNTAGYSHNSGRTQSCTKATQTANSDRNNYRDNNVKHSRDCTAFDKQKQNDVSNVPDLCIHEKQSVPPVVWEPNTSICRKQSLPSPAVCEPNRCIHDKQSVPPAVCEPNRCIHEKQSVSPAVCESNRCIHEKQSLPSTVYESNRCICKKQSLPSTVYDPNRCIHEKQSVSPTVCEPNRCIHEKQSMPSTVCGPNRCIHEPNSMNDTVCDAVTPQIDQTLNWNGLRSILERNRCALLSNSDQISEVEKVLVILVNTDHDGISPSDSEQSPSEDEEEDDKTLDGYEEETVGENDNKLCIAVEYHKCEMLHKENNGYNKNSTIRDSSDGHDGNSGMAQHDTSNIHSCLDQVIIQFRPVTSSQA